MKSMSLVALPKLSMLRPEMLDAVKLSTYMLLIGADASPISSNAFAPAFLIYWITLLALLPE